MELKYMERFFNNKMNMDKTRESSVNSYRTDIKQFIEYFEQLKNIHDEIELLNSISKVDAEDYVLMLKENLAESTINRKITSVKAFMNYLYEDLEIIEKNGFGRIKQIKNVKVTHVKDSISKEQIEKLIEETYKKDRLNDRNFELISFATRALIGIMATSGCRVNELLNAKIKDLEIYYDYYALIINEDNVKNHINKRVIIANKSKKYLDEYLAVRKKLNKNSEYLIANSRGGKWSKELTNKTLEKYSKRAGLNIHLTNHVFRGFMRTTLSKEGYNENIICKIGGWALRDRVAEAYIKDKLITDEYRIKVCNII